MDMYMITFKVVKVEGVEGTYEDLSKAQSKLEKLQERYLGTEFKIRKMTNNNLHKYIDKGDDGIWQVK